MYWGELLLQAAASAEYTYKVADSADPKTEKTLTFNITVVDPTVAPTPDPLAFATGASIADQTYTAGMAITALPLPEAMGGTAPLTYSLTDADGDAIGNGLMFDADTRMLSGTPTAAMAAAEYTYKVTDAATPAMTKMLDFMITVNAGSGSRSADSPTPKRYGYRTRQRQHNGGVDMGKF